MCLTQVTRRYSDFDLLNSSLMVSYASVERRRPILRLILAAAARVVRLTGSLSVQVCGIGLLLPPKKLIGNMDRDFIAERQRGLQAYLDSVTQHPLLCCSLPVKKFLDPNSYSANYTGTLALIHRLAATFKHVCGGVW